MRTPKVLTLILDNMPNICKWQRRFITVLLTTVFALRGRLTFTNMARFSPLHEHTFRRHFAKFFDWIRFNLSVLSLAPFEAPFETGDFIGAFDCTFIPKSGKKTYGLDRFFSSTTSKVERGLEVSVLALIETESQERFTLDATQTPPDLADEHAAYNESYSRIDFYMEQFCDCASVLPQVKYFVADGHYAKEKVFSAITEAGRELVTRLRSDANLRYRYRGPVTAIAVRGSKAQARPSSTMAKCILTTCVDSATWARLRTNRILPYTRSG